MYEKIKTIQKRGYLRAGVSLGINGLSYFDKEKNTWTGFDVDVAKSVSTAIFGCSEAVEFVPLPSAQRFSSLQSHTIDIGTFNATLSLSREVEYGVSFMEPLLYDGEAFMVRKDVLEQVGNVSNMPRRVVSAIRGSTTKQNMEIYFSNNQLDYKIILSDTPNEALAAYENGDCNIHCLDRILLAGERLRLSKPDEHVILPDIVTREAMSPVVSIADPIWATTVKWILKSLIEAEDLGISQENIVEKKEQVSGYLGSFLNPNPEFCKKLGLVNHFTEQVIAQVGNYADIFQRNLGNLSKLQLNRGENSLRSNGGLLSSPLFT